MKFKVSLFLAFFTLGLEAKTGFPSSYYEIKDSAKKKEAFIKILDPLIDVAHERIKKEQAFVKLYFSFDQTPWQTVLQGDLSRLAKKYRIKKLKNRQIFLQRIEIVPKVLVLAQAAAESGWGGSRFVRKANNIFGEWTWGKKGLIPESRDSGKKHKIRIFDSLQDSIDSYMLNLNRHYAYKQFRKARWKALKAGKEFKGMEATNHLKSYSGIGNDYKVLLEGIIHQNRWCEDSILDEIKDRNVTLIESSSTL